MKTRDHNHEWLDVEDIIWRILDNNRSILGQNYISCKSKIEALHKAKGLTALFEGTHAAKDLEEIIDMKIGCMIMDYYTPLKDKIRAFENDGKILQAIILIDREIKNLESDTKPFPQINLIFGELMDWKSRISKNINQLPKMRIPKEGQVYN